MQSRLHYNKNKALSALLLGLGVLLSANTVFAYKTANEKVFYKDINGKKFIKNYSFFARKLDVCEFSSITKKCDKIMFKLKIAHFFYINGLICFKLNLNKASKLILKSIKKNSNDLLSFIKIGETFKNKTILGNDNGAVFDLEKKYLLKKKIIYKI